MLVWAVSVLCFSRTSADPDLWGHVRFGQDLWQTGRIVREDIYSYLTGDQVWINDERLSEAILMPPMDPGLLRRLLSQP